ncbi:MAG: DUF2232 domain-containing protein [Deltaproteobacteria bacterium]|nr:DUF2232 domain-containing protein [Deltaproteobacteria bacterium]
MVVVEAPTPIGRALSLAVITTVVLYLGGAFFPLIGALIGLAAIAPGIYLRFQTDQRWPPTIMVMTVVGILLFGFRSVSPVAVYFFEFGLSSLILDDLLQRRRLGVETLFLSAGLTTFIVILLMLWVSYGQGLTPVALAENFMKANIAGVVTIYENIGVPREQLDTLKLAADAVAAWAGSFFPTLLFVGFYLIHNVGFGAARFFYNRRHGHPPEILRNLSEFAHLQLPQVMVWPLIVALGALFFFPLSGFWQVAALNGAGLIAFAYLIQGLAIVQFTLAAFDLSLIQRSFIFFFFLAFQFLLVLLILLGIFDIWFDFRKRITRYRRSL